MTEDQIQAEFFRRSWNELPQTRRLIFSVPNGGTRNVLEAMKFKATGLIAGIPDMIFLWKGKAYGIEFKTEKGILSKGQILVHETWEENNIPVYLVRSSQQGIDVVLNIMKGAQ